MVTALKTEQVRHLQEHAARLVQELTDLGGRLPLTLGDGPVQPVLIPTAHMPLVPGIENVFWLQLPCAYPETTTCTKIVAGGLAGAYSEKVRVAPSVRLRLIEGALLWWQESWGYDEQGEPNQRRVEYPEELHLAPAELHGFLVLEDFLTYNTFFPALT